MDQSPSQDNRLDAVKLLIIGNSGFLGSFLASSHLGADFKIDSISRSQFDMSKPVSSEFNSFLKNCSYDYAVICSAVTDIERCFLQEEESHQINVVGTIRLLDKLKENDVNPIFLSSDYVFKPSEIPRAEDDERLPQTRYGQQKLLVEQYLEKNFERFLIFRTSKLMSQTVHTKNILLPVIQNLSNGAETRCFDNQWLNPVFIEDIAKALAMSCRQGLNGKFHLGTRQIFTRFELGHLLAEALGADPDLIQPLKMQEISFSEPRPNHNTLNCNKIESLGFKFTEITDVLDQLRSLKQPLR
ncbi:MAG: SDR family oxidoreductase [Bdellovibrionales bacterium]